MASTAYLLSLRKFKCFNVHRVLVGTTNRLALSIFPLDAVVLVSPESFGDEHGVVMILRKDDCFPQDHFRIKAPPARSCD